MDPPELQRSRGLVSQPFTPLSVERLADHITRLTTESIDRVAVRGQMDVIPDLAFPLPLRIMADLLGLPTQDYDRYAVWSQAITGDDPIPELSQYFLELLTERRDTPRPGIISSLFEAPPDWRSLPQAQLLGFFRLLFTCANPEPAPFLRNVAHGFIRHPHPAGHFPAQPP